MRKQQLKPRGIGFPVALDVRLQVKAKRERLSVSKLVVRLVKAGLEKERAA